MIYNGLENHLYPLSVAKVLDVSPTGFLVCRNDETEVMHPGDGVCVFSNKAARQLLGNQEIEQVNLRSICGEHFDFNALNGSGHLNWYFKNTGKWCRIEKSFADAGHDLYTLTDISEEKAAEIRSYEFRKLASDAEETIEFGSWIWNMTSGGFEWTDGVFRLLGYSVRDVLNEDLAVQVLKKNIHPDDIDFIAGKLRDIRSYTGVYVLEFRILAEDGKEKYVYARGHNLIDETTGDMLSMGSAFNVSTLREIQNELESKVNDLNKSNEDLEQFAYVASHDLQEPLRKIISFGERLQLKTEDVLDGEQRMYLSRILNATDRMQKMINNLLEFSRVSSAPDIYEPTDLQAIVRTTLSDLEVVIQQKDALIEVDALPVIDANPTHMSQLFLNLLSNALKFTREGVRPMIRLRLNAVTETELLKRKLDTNRRYIKLTLSDNGVGFSNESASRIFTIFQRLRGRSEFEGAGIGLSVCKKVVDGHGGIIEAFGVPELGATFEIILPESHH